MKHYVSTLSLLQYRILPFPFLTVIWYSIILQEIEEISVWISNTLSDVCIALWETSVSRHHGGTIEGPLKHVHHSTILLRGLWTTLNWVPIISKDASLSDNQCEIFQCGKDKNTLNLYYLNSNSQTLDAITVHFFKLELRPLND